MSKEIFINKETFTCTKKKMKSALEKKGISLSLSDVSNLLAQSFGFKNEYEMQKIYFEKNSMISEKQKQKVNIIKKNDGEKTLINLEIYLPYDNFSPVFDKQIIDTLDKYINNINGHILITGKAGSGKTILMKALKKKKSIFSPIDFKEFNYDPEEEVFSKEHLDIISKSEKNIVFCFHDMLDISGLDVIKKINKDFNLSRIQYVININIIRNL